MRRILIILTMVFFSLSVTQAYSYWLWTPKTGKWTNPKAAVKSTPGEQLDFAKSLYDQNNYKEAKDAFRRLLKSYTKSLEAAESQYYLGLIAEAQGNLYGAYQEYQKVIDKYPFSERIQEIIEREYKIAEKFMGGQSRKTKGITLPIENPSIEIFTTVIENSTYGSLASSAQYKLGLVLKGLARYYEAEEAFNKVISNYPDSEWVEAAKFQIASCRAAVSRSPDYDQGATKEAKERFETFIDEHPYADLSGDAKKNIAQLKEKEAESNYNIGRFYEKQKAYQAAKVYYNGIINTYANSIWAAKALERLQIMEKKK